MNQQYPIRFTTEEQRNRWEAAARREGRNLAGWIRYHCGLAALSPQARRIVVEQSGAPIVLKDHEYYVGEERIPDAVFREIQDLGFHHVMPIGKLGRVNKLGTVG